MDLNTAKARLDEIELKMYAYRNALSTMNTDATTAAPVNSYEGRGIAISILATESYKILTGDELKEVLDTILAAPAEQVDAVTLRRAQLLNEEASRTRCIPENEYAEFQQMMNDSQHAWLKAKQTNDYDSFAPYIDKAVDFQRRFAAYTKPGMDAYDFGLDMFEEGTSQEYYDRFFDEVKATLVPLIAKVNAAPQPDDSWLKVSYPIEQQRKLSEVLMDVLCMDRGHCAIAETEHPFTSGTGSKDVRITTHYYEHDPIASLYSVVHEGGHGTYELNVNPEFDYNCLSGGCSTALHESQSRFWENYVGRSREFTAWLWPKFCEIFPEQTAGHTAEEFYRCVNKAVPGLKRTEADELTYSMHIVIRYELEKRMFTGELTAKDLPAEWNRLYKEYLGLDVPDNSRGVLQDVHWSQGMYGYFPTYSLGTAYSAQILEVLKKDIDFYGLVAEGNLQPIIDWLTDKLYRFGRLPEPQKVVPEICGAPFSAKFYTDYLTKKYTELYNL